MLIRIILASNYSSQASSECDRGRRKNLRCGMNVASKAIIIIPEVATLLDELLRDIRKILGDRLVGLYLDGSLTSGDFDPASDIDFLAVTEAEEPPDPFLKLQALHKQLAISHPRWGVELEGSYISRAAVRRYDPALAMHPNLERGVTETLKMVPHDVDWIIHYHVVRECGIPLFGPDPKTLIDPISPDSLRQAMRPNLEKWWQPMLADPAPLQCPGYQSYAVLTMCRICFTMAEGKVASKADATRWAKQRLDKRWAPLIDRALAGRLAPNPEIPPDEIALTQEFIRLAVAISTAA
jgi:predicted nucleotidyltransferase